MEQRVQLRAPRHREDTFAIEEHEAERCCVLDLDKDERLVLVVTRREKPDWTETVTIEIERRFYEVAAKTTRPEGRYRSFVYVLRELHPAAIIRRLIRYEPPRPGSS